MAERCIVQQNPGKGIVCFISSSSYLSDPSFVVMRQRFLNEFDYLWFDCMNGSSRGTGKLTPTGEPDPSVFSTEYNREGIRVGTAISLMVRQENRSQTPTVRFRHFWGANKRANLLSGLGNQNFDEQYKISQPNRENRLSFRLLETSKAYLSWAALADLSDRPPFRAFIEARRGVLIDIEKSELERRMQLYFDSTVTWKDIKEQQPELTEDAARFDAEKARKKVIAVENYSQKHIRRYTVRPFENRWCYHSTIRPLWNEPRPELWAQCWEGNKFLVTRLKTEKEAKGSPIYFSSALVDYQAIARNVSVFPLQLRSVQGNSDAAVAEQLKIDGITDIAIEATARANLSPVVRTYLAELGITDPDTDAETAALIWMHVLAIGYSPAYLEENADGIRENFPRIPLPDNRETLIASANLGRQIAALLDPETPVTGVTSGKLRPELKVIAVTSRVGAGNLDPNTDFALTAGWGYAGQNGVTMPGRGKVIDRAYTSEEQSAIAQVTEQLGTATHDIYLNDIAYWKNIPDRVWNHTIGGYQVIKKWLSYREQKLLRRSLKLEEVTEVSQMARRIAAILLLEPQLNANYETVKHANYPWSVQKQ